MNKYITVEEEQFNAFLDDYPNELQYEIDGDFGTYNDFNDGRKYPDSIAAKVKITGETVFYIRTQISPY